jgi:hypothetical protein
MSVLSSCDAFRPLQTRFGQWTWCWDCRITICVHFSSPPHILLAPVMPHPKLPVLTEQYEVQLNVRPATSVRAHRKSRVQLCNFDSRWYRWSRLYPCRSTSGRRSPGIYLRLGGPHGLSVRQRKRLLAPTWFELRTAQPVASSYTDFAIPDNYWGFPCFFLSCKANARV